MLPAAPFSEAQPLPVDTVLAYSAANFGVNMVNAFSNAALPLYLADYGLPNWAIGLLAQERSLVGGPVQPLIGAISDRTRTRFGKRKPFFLVGVPLTAAALLWLAGRPPLWAVLLVIPVFALFLAVANDPYLALMADITPRRQRGLVGGYLALFNMLGQVTLLALASLLWVDRQPLVFVAVASGLALGFAVTFIGVREARPDMVQARPAGRLQIRPVQYVRNVLRHREMSKYVGAQFFFWLGNGAAVPFITRFAVEVLGVSEGQAFDIMLVAVACTAASAVPAGWLGSRFGKQPVLAIGLLAFALTALIGSQARSVPQAVAAMAALGVCNAIATALTFPLLADLMPRDRLGEFTGVGSLVWSLAQPLGSFSAGVVIDLTGSYRSVFVVSGLLMLLSFSLLLTVRVDRTQQEEEG